jgi:hypothetical protein
MYLICLWNVATLALGSRPRQGFARLWAKKEVESHTTYFRKCERVWRNEPSHLQGVPLGSPRTKSHLDVGPVERCKVYYKGEGCGFPQVRVVMSLVSPSCPWLILTAKVLQLRTNHLVLVLCRPVWVSKAYQIFLVPSWSSSTPLYPSKVSRARECALTPYPSAVFCLRLTFESFKESGAHHQIISLV